MTKVYLFYLDKSMYAFTEDKEIAESFRNARTKRFVCIKKKIDKEYEEDYRLFRADNSKRMLFMSPIECEHYDGGRKSKISEQDVLQIAMTPEENAILEERMMTIDDRIHRVGLVLDEKLSPLKDKYNEILKELQSITYLELDILDIFIDLFPDTFDVQVE